MTTMPTRRDILDQTAARRDEARSLLEALRDAKRVSEENLATLGRRDLVKDVTGRSSLDTAIERTHGLVESFNRVLADLSANLDDEDAALLAELVDSPAN